MKKTERRRWQCPGCTRVFMIPEIAQDPNLCPECEATSGKSTGENEDHKAEKAMSEVESHRELSNKLAIEKFL